MYLVKIMVQITSSTKTWYYYLVKIMIGKEMIKYDVNFFNTWHWIINTYIRLTTCKIKNFTSLKNDEEVKYFS
jgi:hypothetical protein